MNTQTQTDEKRTLSAPVELRADGETNKISGTAAVFFREDDPGTQFQLWAGENPAFERIMPGAFDATMQRDDVMASFNHNLDSLLGRTSSGTLRLTVDETGLRYEITPGSTSHHRDVVEMIERGDVRGSSFWFQIPEGGDEWRTEGNTEIREIRQVNLIEVGPVSNPAYKSTDANLRSLQETRENARKQREQHKIDQEKAARTRELELNEISGFRENIYIDPAK